MEGSTAFEVGVVELLAVGIEGGMGGESGVVSGEGGEVGAVGWLVEVVDGGVVEDLVVGGGEAGGGG